MGDAVGGLAWLKVDDEGCSERELNKVDELAQRIQNALEEHGGELTTKELLDATGAQRGSLWDRAVNKTLDQGQVQRISHGRYAPTDNKS